MSSQEASAENLEVGEEKKLNFREALQQAMKRKLTDIQAGLNWSLISIKIAKEKVK